ncbi:MAG: galactokinase [Candidatus Sulfotelmatobacter sp.]
MGSIELASQFVQKFGERPLIFRAPGRVNLIGEHTDYNDGFVMPSAIGFCTRVAASVREDRKLVIASEQFAGSSEFDIDHLPERGSGKWCDYVLGVAVMLQQSGHRLRGANLLVNGDIPIGAGLSSSAAIEVATALAFMALSHVALPMPEVAKLCRRCENNFIGARVGIMDQFVSCLGRAGHALLLDCRSLKFELIPIPKNVRMVVCNTMVKHQHAGGEYNRRREECEEGVRLLSKWFPEIRALRDVTSEQLMRHEGEIPEKIFRRCRHVAEENGRVLEGARRLHDGDVSGFGRLMRESHRSLRDLYEVSCRELDGMVEAAEGLPGYYGGRMTGGGFGGCTLNLVETSKAEEFAQLISKRYEAAAGIRPEIYICSAGDGAGVDGIG